MDSITLMSRDQLARELVGDQIPHLELVASDRGSRAFVPSAPSGFDGTVQRKLELAREILLRDQQRTMKRFGVFLARDTMREWLAMRYCGVEREIFIVLFLDTGHRLIAAEDVATGTVDRTAVHPREIVKLGLRHNASAALFAHNHPSGVVTPSVQDVALTKALKAAMALVEINVLDHYIVAGRQILSFAEQGLL